MYRPRVKICCISSLEEASLAIQFGASALGLVGAMPSGPGVISDELIRTIALQTPPPIATFLLTSETSAADILDHQLRTGANTVQLVDAVADDAYAVLRSKLPSSVKLVQVIHVLDENTIDEALAAAEHVDALLLDSGNPNLVVKELGGTGRVHNWQISRRIREESRVPVFLAGGLGPHNVREAIEAVEPYGLDLCSGVRTEGKLDVRKLEAFFEAVNRL